MSRTKSAVWSISLDGRDLFRLAASAARRKVKAVIGHGPQHQSERDWPEQGLAALEAIVGMERSQLWHAALADNLRRLGQAAEAAGELETAAQWRPPRDNGDCFCLVSLM
jgi:hypothetical protein